MTEYTNYEDNLYSYPEKSGLTIVAEIDYSSGSYEFDTRVVWRNQAGELFTARDSGCSCPTPFETYNLKNIDRVDFDELQREIQEELTPKYEGQTLYVTHTQAQEFLETVRQELRAKKGQLYRQDT